MANKVLRDMRMEGLIPEENEGRIREHLHLLVNAVACVERGYYGRHNGKKIIQFNLQWEKIGEYDNQLIAARAVGYSDRAILRSLKSGRKSRAGHYWKYANENTCGS